MGSIINLTLEDDLIEFLAGRLYDDYRSGSDFSHSTVIFPGKRPGIYLRRALARRIKRSFIPPEVYSVEEFVRGLFLSRNPRWRQVSMLDCAGILYEIMKKLDLEAFAWQKELGFDAFLLWARKLAEVMEHVDTECVDNDVLRGIEKNAEIGYDVPAYVNRILENLHQIREHFHAFLEEERLFTNGFIHKCLAGDIGEYAAEFPAGTVYLAGFFALTRSEQILFKELLRRDETVLVWHRASDERSAEIFGEMETAFDMRAEELPAREKRPRSGRGKRGPRIFEAFDTHSEVKQVRAILKELDEPEDTCIVLADEGKLIPLLFQVTDVLSAGYNVSLGYPVRYTSVYALIEALFNVQQTRSREGLYYTKEYLKVLMHPFVKNIGEGKEEAAATRILIHTVEEALLGIPNEESFRKKVFVNPEDVLACEEIFVKAAERSGHAGAVVTAGHLRDRLKGLHTVFFTPFESFRSIESFLGALEAALQFVLHRSAVSQYVFSAKIFERVFEIIEEMRSSFYIDEIQADMTSACDLFRFYLYFERIPFYGSPLKGTQILGLLETRNINFKNVIILDVNEDCLPQVRDTDSLLPLGVAAQLGLNTFRRSEAIFHYHFFRLCRSAEKMYILYRNAPQERVYRSRFIEELIWEREKENGAVFADEAKSGVVEKVAVSLGIRREGCVIEKMPETHALMKGIVFSSTSIDTYMRCPARFYFQYVLRLREKEEIEDDIEARDIGNFIHTLLKDFYAPFTGKRLTLPEDASGKLLESARAHFDRFFTADTPDKQFLWGVTRFKLAEFVKREKEKAFVWKILHLEEEFSYEKNSACSIETPYGTAPLKGIFDRVEEQGRGADKKIVILDYKTGGIPAVRLGRSSGLLTRSQTKECLYSVQLPLYMYLYRQCYPRYGWSDIEAGFYSFKQIADPKNAWVPFFGARFAPQAATLMEEHIMPAIRRLAGEILDPATPFVRDDDDSSYCAHCPYSGLCRK